MWPFTRRETRAVEPAASYTDVLTALLTARAEGVASDPAATAALETAAGLVARAFAVATVAPAGARTAALSAPVLACIGRELIRRGEAVFVLSVDRGRVQALPASHWEVRGGRTPDSWWYRLDMPAPDDTGDDTGSRRRSASLPVCFGPARAVARYCAARLGIRHGQAVRCTRTGSCGRSGRAVRARHSDSRHCDRSDRA